MEGVRSDLASEPQFWIVRAGKRGRHAADFEGLGIVAIGFKEAGDPTGLDREQLFGQARFLLVTEPAGLEGFARALAAPAAAPEIPPAATALPDMEPVLRAAADHGLEILGPPGIPASRHIDRDFREDRT